MSSFHFPAAVGITHLRVYDSNGSDGLHGGSPHVHLVSAEAYITTSGSGEVQMYSREGFQARQLEVGAVVWFEPGVIHRLINTSRELEILVVMQNAGLPEAGDAVFTFPREVMASAEAYDRSAALPAGAVDARKQAAWARRDLAIEGFAELQAAADREAALDEFYRLAIERRAHLFDRWSHLLAEGAERECQRARERLEGLVAQSTAHLATACHAATPGGDAHEGVGMCGMLRQYDLLAPGEPE
jgi:mannose-6-phosphate isomerase-like protein (cupin superfamily)